LPSDWAEDHPLLSTYDNGPITVLGKLRAEAIHTHLYIPESLAKSALELIKTSRDEFETQWLQYYHEDALEKMEPPVIDIPAWDVLCGYCGIDFLPPHIEKGDAR
jgi:hypothetical protein